MSLGLADADALDLNTGAFGAAPESVRSLAADLRDQQLRAPHDFMTRQVPELLWASRVALADFIGTDATRLMFTTNVTAGVNLLASGLPGQGAGDIVVTDAEYQPMRWTWERAAQRRGLAIKTVAVPEPLVDVGKLLAAFAAVISATTKIVFVSHVVSATGAVLPVREICALARERGAITVVDGAHGPVFTPLDVREIGCDFYVGSGHKWLRAPAGVGFVHCDPTLLERVDPDQVSWAYEDVAHAPNLHACNEFGSTPLLRRHECQGTRDLIPWLVLPEVIEHHRRSDADAGRRRAADLAARTRTRLTARYGWECLTPTAPERCGGMLSFRLPVDLDGGAVATRLWECHRITVATFPRPTGDLLRLSIAANTCPADIDRLCSALDRAAPPTTPDH